MSGKLKGRGRGVRGDYTQSYPEDPMHSDAEIAKRVKASKERI